MLIAVCAAMMVPLAGSASASTYTRIKSAAVEKCLGISNYGKGSEVEMAKCATYSQEYWFVDPLFSNRVRLRNGDPDAWNKCIDASRGNARQLFVIRCDGSANQAFIQRFLPNSTSFFTLESARYPGLCADVKDWGQSHVVQLWSCHSGSNQVWWYWK